MRLVTTDRSADETPRRGVFVLLSNSWEKPRKNLDVRVAIDADFHRGRKAESRKFVDLHTLGGDPRDLALSRNTYEVEHGSAQHPLRNGHDVAFLLCETAESQPVVRVHGAMNSEWGDERKWGMSRAFGEDFEFRLRVSAYDKLGRETLIVSHYAVRFSTWKAVQIRREWQGEWWPVSGVSPLDMPRRPWPVRHLSIRFLEPEIPWSRLLDGRVVSRRP